MYTGYSVCSLIPSLHFATPHVRTKYTCNDSSIYPSSHSTPHFITTSPSPFLGHITRHSLPHWCTNSNFTRVHTPHTSLRHTYILRFVIPSHVHHSIHRFALYLFRFTHNDFVNAASIIFSSHLITSMTHQSRNMLSLPHSYAHVSTLLKNRYDAHKEAKTFHMLLKSQERPSQRFMVHMSYLSTMCSPQAQPSMKQSVPANKLAHTQLSHAFFVQHKLHFSAFASAIF